MNEVSVIRERNIGGGREVTTVVTYAAPNQNIIAEYFVNEIFCIRLLNF